jgi:hypothetical protein
MSEAAVVIPLALRRVSRATRLQVLLQLPPALALLVSASTRLSSGGSVAGTALGAAQIAGAALLVMVSLRELAGRAGHRRLAAVDLTAGLLLLLEWGSRLAEGGKLFSPALLSGVVGMVLGLVPLWAPDWRTRRRAVRLDGVGISYRSSPLRGFRVDWAELASVGRSGGRMELRSRDGRIRAVRLDALENAEPVWVAVSAAARRAGVPVSGPPAGLEVAP